MSDGARYRRVYANDWHHPAFRRLNDSARVVRFYVAAGPQTTSVGCFRLSTALAVEDLGGTAEFFEERLGIVCDAFSWAWDPVARVIWIRDWFGSNPPSSPNVVASWVKLLRNVPDCQVRDEAYQSITVSLKNLQASFREPWGELSRTFRKAEIQSETNQGSGIRDQKSGNKGTGALRADGSDGKGVRRAGSGADERAVSIARKALTHTNPDAPIEHLVDVFHQVSRTEGVEQPLSRVKVVAALTTALSDRTQEKRA